MADDTRGETEGKTTAELKAMNKAKRKAIVEGVMKTPTLTKTPFKHPPYEYKPKAKPSREPWKNPLTFSKPMGNVDPATYPWKQHAERKNLYKSLAKPPGALAGALKFTSDPAPPQGSGKDQDSELDAALQQGIETQAGIDAAPAIVRAVQESEVEARPGTPVKKELSVPVSGQGKSGGLKLEQIIDPESFEAKVGSMSAPMRAFAASVLGLPADTFQSIEQMTINQMRERGQLRVTAMLSEPESPLSIASASGHNTEVLRILASEGVISAQQYANSIVSITGQLQSHQRYRDAQASGHHAANIQSVLSVMGVDPEVIAAGGGQFDEEQYTSTLADRDTGEVYGVMADISAYWTDVKSGLYDREMALGDRHENIVENTRAAVTRLVVPAMRRLGGDADFVTVDHDSNRITLDDQQIIGFTNNNFDGFRDTMNETLEVSSIVSGQFNGEWQSNANQFAWLFGIMSSEHPGVAVNYDVYVGDTLLYPVTATTDDDYREPVSAQVKPKE